MPTGSEKIYSARHIILDYKNHKIKTKHESKNIRNPSLLCAMRHGLSDQALLQ